MNDITSLRNDCIIKQKRGLHFILASVVIWTAVLIIHLSPLSAATKSMLTFCCSTPLMPLALLFSRIIKADFQNKGNPLSNLGIILSIAQIPYLLIAMWTLSEVPDSFLMIYAMIFGAHLLPFGWLYNSKAYYILSAVIPIAALIIGINLPSFTVAAFMLFVEIAFCAWLGIENKQGGK